MSFLLVIARQMHTSLFAAIHISVRGWVGNTISSLRSEREDL